MSKKLYMAGFVPFLAFVAMAIPTAAQAAPHFYLPNIVPATGAPTLAWGNLTLTSAAGTITCENAVLGREANPGGVAGGAGTDTTLAFGSGNCVNETCPGVSYVQPIGLPWPSQLVLNGKGEIQDESFNVKVIIGCENPTEKGVGTGFAPNGGAILGSIEFETNANNKQTPLTENTGTSGCNKPSEINFNEESGSLSALGEAVIGKTSGKLKVCGYEKSQLSLTKNP